MQSKVKYIVGLTQIFLVLSVIFIPVQGQARDVQQQEFDTLGKNGSRLFYQIDSTGSRHFTFLTGPDTGEPNGEPYEASHSFQYGVLDTLTNTTEFIENVTSQLVYPYHYTFEVDTLGRVHTAYISGNYTLYYAIRSSSGDWTSIELTNSTQFFAIAPDIELGTGEQPRIIFKSIYKEGINDFFGNSFPLSSIRAVMYTRFDGNDWTKPVDISDNSGFTAQQGNIFDSYNPGMIISEGTVYAAYTVKVSVAAESRMRYVWFPEDATSFKQNGGSFTEQTHKFVMISSTISTTYTRPVLILHEEGIAILTGSFIFGGATVSFLPDRFEEPNPDPTIARTQINYREIDRSIRSNSVPAVDAVQDNAGNIHVIYSFRDVFDESENRYTFDINLVTISPEGGNASLSGTIFKVTDTQNIDHSFPDVSLTEEGDLEILHMRRNDTDIYSLHMAYVSPPKSFPAQARFAFFLVLIVSGLIVTGWYLLVQKLPVKEKKEEEILPHKVNLREAITED